MRKPFLTMLAIFALAGAAYYFWHVTKVAPENDQPPSWVSSTDLKSTQIMPSIDTPLMPGRSAIWCASFQLAWDRLCDDVNGADLTSSHPQPLLALPPCRPSPLFPEAMPQCALGWLSCR